MALVFRVKDCSPSAKFAGPYSDSSGNEVDEISAVRCHRCFLAFVEAIGFDASDAIKRLLVTKND